MSQKEKLIEHFLKYGKTDSWLNLAKTFDILTGESNKKQSDKVRRIYNSIKFPTKNVVNSIEVPKHTSTRKTSVKLLNPYTGGNPDNILVIPDIHIPFEHKDALEFCRAQQEKYDCGKVVFIGDIVDGHAWSYHEKSNSSMSALEEYNVSMDKLSNWYYTFPEAVVTVGNHDRLKERRLQTAGLLKEFIKPLNEIYNVPNWKFVNEYMYNGVLYIHGEQGNAESKVKSEFVPVVQGHHHTEGSIKLFAGHDKQLFAMQVGTLIDFESYAFAYAQRGKKPILSCGIVLNNQPVLIPLW